jgi:hypothetical protein
MQLLWLLLLLLLVLLLWLRHPFCPRSLHFDYMYC